MGKIKINSKHKVLIVVEGKHDKTFLEGFLDHLKADKSQILIEYAEGVPNIIPTIDELFRSLEGHQYPQILIIIVDRDSHLAKTPKHFEVLCRYLNDNNFPVPSAENTLSEALNGFKTGIYVMPGSGEGHMIEDLLFQSIEKDQQKLIKDFFSGFDALPADKKHDHQFDRVKNEPKRIPPKANLRAYTATFDHDLKYDDIMKSHWDFNHDAFKELEGFLRGILHDIESN